METKQMKVDWDKPIEVVSEVTGKAVDAKVKSISKELNVAAVEFYLFGRDWVLLFNINDPVGLTLKFFVRNKNTVDGVIEELRGLFGTMEYHANTRMLHGEEKNLLASTFHKKLEELKNMIGK